MKRLLRTIVLSVALLTPLPVQARAAEYLIPVGRVIGLQLQNETITVAAYDDALGSNAREAGLKIGDEILRVDGREVSCPEEIREAVSSGEAVELTVRRGSRQAAVTMTPVQTEDGPRLGVYLRQGIAGIGTVTFYDPESGLFGTLGHGVSDSGGSLLKMTRGSAYEAGVVSVKKGKSGDPGQLKGSALSEKPLGSLLRNTAQGVFGTCPQGWTGSALPVAQYHQITTGSATIRCQVGGGEVREYSVELLKIYPQTRPDGRNFLLKVTDPALLEATGGIVQGMGVSYNRDNTGTLKACKG